MVKGGGQWEREVYLIWRDITLIIVGKRQYMNKGKGSQWERDVAKYLTQWLTGQSKEYYFWRSPGSGSVATISNENKDLHGDIIPLKEEANILCSRFIVECKNGYSSASFDKHLKYNKSDDIRDFWIQTCGPANPIKKFPMLIYKKKGLPTPWLGIDHSIFNFLYKYIQGLRFIHLCWGEELRDTYFFEYKEFFSVIKPDMIREIKWDID